MMRRFFVFYHWDKRERELLRELNQAKISKLYFLNTSKFGFSIFEKLRIT